MPRYGLLRGACHRAAVCADPLARNDGVRYPLSPAAMQPQPLIGIFADPALDHRGNRRRRALNFDFTRGVADWLYFVREYGAQTDIGQADDPHAMYRAFDLPQGAGE